MKFYEFFNKLHENSNNSNKEKYLLEVFSALCGETNPFAANKECPFSSVLPVGLIGEDSTYRKRVCNGRDKKYKGLSAPIKNHIRGIENKETFVNYLEKSVLPEAFSKLCSAFEISDTVDRVVMFESIYEQFKIFVYSSTDEVEYIVPEMVKRISTNQTKTIEPISEDPISKPDNSKNEVPPQNETPAEKKPKKVEVLVNDFKKTIDDDYRIKNIMNGELTNNKSLDRDLLSRVTSFINDLESYVIKPYNRKPYNEKKRYIKIEQFLQKMKDFNEYLKMSLSPTDPESNQDSGVEDKIEKCQQRLKSLYKEICGNDKVE